MEAINTYNENSILNGGFNISRLQTECAIIVEKNIVKDGNLKDEEVMKQAGDTHKDQRETLPEKNFHVSNNSDNVHPEDKTIALLNVERNRLRCEGHINESFENQDLKLVSAEDINGKDDDTSSSTRKESIAPSIQITDEHSSTKEIQGHLAVISEEPAKETTSSDEEDDKLPVLDLCECGTKAGRDPPNTPCYFCSYNQKRGRLTERRVSLGLPGRFGGDSSNGLRDRNRRASVHADFGIDESSLSKGPHLTNDSLQHHPRRGNFFIPISVDDMAHSHGASSRRTSVHSSITIGDPSKEELSTPVMIFCKHRLQKISCSIPCAIGMTILILGTKPKILTFLNYFALLTVLVFYPLFGVLDTAFIYARKRFNLCPSKSSEKDDENPLGTFGHLDNPPDLIPQRRQRSASIISRISSFNTLPSITEEGLSEENEIGNSNGKSGSCKESINGRRYRPCEECVKESRLGTICTHRFKGDGAAAVDI